MPSRNSHNIQADRRFCEFRRWRCPISRSWFSLGARIRIMGTNNAELSEDPVRLVKRLKRRDRRSLASPLESRPAQAHIADALLSYAVYPNQPSRIHC